MKSLVPYSSLKAQCRNMDRLVVEFDANICVAIQIKKMTVENNVYLAKLAEQAERYEGVFVSICWPAPQSLTGDVFQRWWIA